MWRRLVQGVWWLMIIEFNRNTIMQMTLYQTNINFIKKSDRKELVLSLRSHKHWKIANRIFLVLTFESAKCKMSDQKKGIRKKAIFYDTCMKNMKMKWATLDHSMEHSAFKNNTSVDKKEIDYSEVRIHSFIGRHLFAYLHGG